MVTFFVGHLRLDCRGPVEVIVGAGVVVGAEIGITTIVRASLPIRMIHPTKAMSSRWSNSFGGGWLSSQCPAPEIYVDPGLWVLSSSLDVGSQTDCR